MTARPDPLAPLRRIPGVVESMTQARNALAAVHRRPVNLRRPEITGAEGVLRGARAGALIDGAVPGGAGEESAVVARNIDVYSVLAPEFVQDTARVFLRSPLQVLARMDVLAGGNGRPERAVGELMVLAATVTSGADPDLLPGIVHGQLLSTSAFGERTGVIARAASRLAAVAGGFDPRGLAVPEPWLNRYRAEYRAAGESFGTGPEGVGRFLVLHMRSFVAGAEEAEGIAAAL
ncbi:hypothetical protein JIM95_005335 [Corynebacterium sp. CCM 8835]|uniref:Oxidoreductase n=2 Tax=Corynebacterium antarcticum TaxID=2800405 RepID=A0A9Q4GMP7_9CORY|nr:hypothetical protein [Corynebacterium antarcticum]MCK7642499.1 hypothetical protein [Corynebacterium antarcticum]MCK7660816.1 hypothetical protein [Corynebacterium antarcticum]MCL0245563.1 hypothetical protein [Corynebacterium antarcticum]MCX7491981.1 hypothetical protein [Corynebacterium antarcticum]MCX7537971.1 hypothetical protein [Corynebacterium antarcticum]